MDRQTVTSLFAIPKTKNHYLVTTFVEYRKKLFPLIDDFLSHNTYESIVILTGQVQNIELATQSESRCVINYKFLIKKHTVLDKIVLWVCNYTDKSVFLNF